jgi:hypothetical protein
LPQQLADSPVRHLTSAEMLARVNRNHGLKVSSWRFREAIVTGAIPVERGPDGRSWASDPADEAEIVAYFQAAEPTPLTRPKPRPRPADPQLPPAA